MQQFEALRYPVGTALAFVGAGGKTTALFMLARELINNAQASGPLKTVLVTTTTHLGDWQSQLADHTVRVKSKSDIGQLAHNFPEGVLLVVGGEAKNRLTGLDGQVLEELRMVAEDHGLPLLIEADGSRNHPLKAPAVYEPVIPDFVQTVVVVAGLFGLEKKLIDQWVHHPEIFSRLSGINSGEKISVEALARVLCHKEGGLKNIPMNARRIALLNQADTNLLKAKGRTISDSLIDDYHSVIIASLSAGSIIYSAIDDNETYKRSEIHAVIEPIAGIILAAGASSRFGTPKQLLLWKGQPFIRYVILAALQAGLSPVIVVIGDSSQLVIPAISDLPVRIVMNYDYLAGVSTSIKKGINALPKYLGGAIFFQADQPQVSIQLINFLVEKHQQDLKPIIAPLIDGQRGNPVLFDVNIFNELLSLEGDMGGRSLFSKFPVEWIPWHDPNQLLDVDTPEDYLRFLAIYKDRESRL